MTKYVIISKAEYERLKELEKRMNILTQDIEMQKNTFLHELEMLKQKQNNEPVELSAKIQEHKQKINDAYMEMQHQQVTSIVSSFIPLDPLSPVH